MTRILVIEDDAGVRENLLELLDAEGYEISSAENGQAGLELAREKAPDLIICDIMMPRMDGYEVWAALAGDPLTATVPFIFLTAKTDRSDMRRGMELGVDDYIAKPYQREEVLRAIEARLNKRRVITDQSQKRLNDLRSSITRSLPHEMLTPLSVIMGYADLLENGNSPIDRAEAAGVGHEIQTAAQRLLLTIQNYLLFAELELLATDAEQVASLRDTRLEHARPAVVEMALAKVLQENRQDRLRLLVSDASVCIAEMYLQKIVEDLLDNALKYSEPGTPVEVSGEVDGEEGMYLLSVTDHGRGMSPEQLASIGGLMQFDRKRYEQQGAGLGLAIVKRLASLHDGKVEIQSAPGKGTTVRVWVPLA